MTTGLALILILGATAGAIFLTQMWQMNYFKRENFKMRKKNTIDESRIKMKKLEKELGLNGSKTPVEHKTPDVLDLLSNLNKDNVGIILELLRSKENIHDEPKSDFEILMKLVPPNIIEGFINSLTQKQQEQNQGHYQH